MDKEEIIKRFQDIMSEPIDWSNLDQLAADIWLFLTNDSNPERASIPRDAFLHEVKSMMESVKITNERKQAIAFVEFGIKNKYTKSPVSGFFSNQPPDAGKQTWFTLQELYELFLQSQQQTPTT
jgi:hypothetical protein